MAKVNYFDFDFTSNSSAGNGFCWTTSPLTPEKLYEMPGIEMYGYQQDWSSVMQNINAWFQRFEGTSENPYKGLYTGTPSTNYKLPYFNEYHHNTSQNWQENQGPLGPYIQKLTDLAESAARAALPAAGILYPKSYAGVGTSSYTFTFNLINTNASNGADSIVDNIEKNQYFIHQFVRDNLHDQNGNLSIIPPLIYEIYIPGIRWSPASIVSGFTVNNKGTLNKNTYDIMPGLKKEYIYPDAWEVTISITELINESRRIWNDAIKGGGYSATGGGEIITKVFE